MTRTIRLVSISLLLTLGAAVLPSVAAEETHWFVSIERVNVAPIKRSDVSQLIEVGIVETDGFSELVFSLGGEFKEGVPTEGRVGAILIPDIDVALHLLRNEGEFVFPLEAIYEVSPLKAALFMSEQITAKVAFPRYRVFLYNETTSGATVSLFIYRTRN